MLAALLACAAGTDQDVDALIPHCRRIVDTEQDEPGLGIPTLERRYRTQQHPPAECRTQTHFELPMRCGIGLESANGFLECVQHLTSVPIETPTLGGELQRACRSTEEQDAQTFFQALDCPADRRRINEQMARCCHEAAALDSPDEHFDRADTRTHAISREHYCDFRIT